MAGNRNRNNSGGAALATQRDSTTRDTTGRNPAPKRPVQVEAPDGSAPITHEMVAARAYELWKIRGGDAEQNWHEAEDLLRHGL